MWKAIDGVSSFASELTEKSSQIHKLETDLRIIRDIIPRIDSLEHKLGHSAEGLSKLYNDARLILEYCLEGTMYQILSDARENAPKDIISYYEQTEITEQWLEDQTKMINEYLSYSLERLVRTKWGYELTVLLHQAEEEGNQYVTTMPLDKRPTNIDPYKFREYGIAKTKYDRVVMFLLQQDRKKEKMLVDYLDTLQGRLRNRGD